MGVSINTCYYESKIQELFLAYEYQQKKQEEKEAQRAAREELREAAKLQKEIEEQRKKALKEQSHYQNALTKILEQIKASANPSQDLLNKKAELENQLHNIDSAIKDLDYREANQRAGYVYVISNIGAFGENIYKIGMTRRLDPQDRVDELGDASVPFRFDVHAMIFSDDAPALKNALHKAFENKKVNMVNQRREFFNVTLDEIKEVVRKNYDKTVEFIQYPDAEQFRESQLIRQQLGMEKLKHQDPIFVPTPTPNAKNTTTTNVAARPISLDPAKTYLKTKWGIYEMPKQYKIKLTYGPRTDIKPVM